jgi:hypothetical protein
MNGVCQTVKAGNTCIFWKKAGCSYNGGTCYPVVDACEGCQRIKDFPTGQYCISFSEPDLKWKLGACNLATHVKRNNGNGESKKLNPLKASKRMAAGK